MAKYRVTITGADYEAMADLRRRYHVSVQPNTVRRSRTKGQVSVQAIVDDARIAELEQAGYHVQRHENLEEVGRERQAEVSQGNRYLQR
jgi:hypothetical protein